MAYLQCDSPDVEKLLSYLVHFNGCFLHGSSDHLFKSLDHEKLLPHFMHLNCFSPLSFLSWIVMWKSSWDFNGFFPSWILWWYSKYFDPEKLLPHFVQLNGFSPAWFPLRIFTWCGKAPVTFGALQWLFPLRILWWYYKYFDHEKLLPHFVQLNGFSPVWFPSWVFTRYGKAPDTFGALQWLYPSWILWWYFSLQVSWSWEALATLYALELLLPSVIPFMNRDVENLLRLQWFLSFMDPLMVL